MLAHAHGRPLSAAVFASILEPMRSGDELEAPCPHLSSAVFPDYFIDRAKRCWKLAKSIRDPALAQAFVERANVLRSVAISAEGAVGAPRPSLVESEAKTARSLRRELSQLLPGMSLAVQVADFVALCPRDAWHESRRLAEEFGCAAEFRPDGRVWFVKRH